MSRLPPPQRFVTRLHTMAVAAALASPFAANAAIYSCVDAKGTRLTSDRPIPECNDRVQNEHNKSGTVKRQIAPQLTAQERAAKEVQDQKAAEARAQHRALARCFERTQAGRHLTTDEAGADHGDASGTAGHTLAQVQ